MDCGENDFCASLPRETLLTLCAGCNRRHVKAGSIDVMDDRSRMLLVIEGVYMGESYADGPESPAEQFALCFPGRLLNQDVLLGMRPPGPPSFSVAKCLTDCVIASFDLRLARTLYAEDPLFAKRAAESAINIMYDYALFCSIMRQEGGAAKVGKLFELLANRGIYLPSKSVAELLSCNRATVTRAIAAIKKADPDLWSSYAGCKQR